MAAKDRQAQADSSSRHSAPGYDLPQPQERPLPLQPMPVALE